MALKGFTDLPYHWSQAAGSHLPDKFISATPARMNCCNPYPCSRGAAGFVRQESRQASSLKAPLPETALAEGLWGACDPLQTKDY